VVVRTLREYADDEGNTGTTTVLRMQVGGPGRPTTSGRAIHWHADPAVRVEFVSTDVGRQTIPYVKVTRADGRTTEYVAEGTPAGSVPAGAHRVMDCADCHSTTGHHIAPTAEKAVDNAIASGRLSARLPFIRRDAVRLLKAEQATEQAALDAIASELRAAYPASAVAAVQDVYRANIFPTMKVAPGTYPDNIGHLTSSGCFRCHDGSHTAKVGGVLSFADYDVSKRLNGNPLFTYRGDISWDFPASASFGSGSADLNDGLRQKRPRRTLDFKRSSIHFTAKSLR
jgi:hypothetical protein